MKYYEIKSPFHTFAKNKYAMRRILLKFSIGIIFMTMCPFIMSSDENVPLVQTKGREREYSQSEMDEIYTSIDEYVNAFITSETPDDFFNYLKIQYPGKNGEIEILKAAMDGFIALDVNEDEGKYVKKLMGIVDNSNLNDDSKKDVKSSLAVANASTRLWNEAALVEP